jgi:CRISPR/Cas system CMR subunit Cmr4 (Cas7 group RAMP superfamily)
MDPAFLTPRGITRRLVIEADLELTAPATLGGSDPTAVTDAPIARDARTGQPIFYGTTFAGLLRQALANRLAGPRRGEPNTVGGVFGSADNLQSSIVTDDALGVSASGTILRDGVSIEPASAVARKGHKYDLELLPPGTRFPIRLDLYLDGNDDAARLSHLLTCMHALENEEVLLGGRTRKGFGYSRVREQEREGGDPYRWTVRDFDVSTTTGTLQWMAFESEDAMPAGWPILAPERFASVVDLAERFPQAEIHEASYPEFRAEVELEIPASLLIRSGGYETDAADAVHLREPDLAGDLQPVISGTSLGGAIRSQALRIANTVSGTSSGRGAELVYRMFGPSPNSRRPRAGYLFLKGAPIEGGRTLRHARVRIDRWTGGALDHLLFEVDAQFGGRVRLDFRIPLPADEEDSQAMIGLFLNVLKDLFTAEIPLGGEGNIGRGRLLGTAAALSHRQSNASEEAWVLNGTGRQTRFFEISQGMPATLQGFVDAFSASVAAEPEEVTA